MQDKTVKPQILPDLNHFHMRNYVLLVGILGLKQLFEMWKYRFEICFIIKPGYSSVFYYLDLCPSCLFICALWCGFLFWLYGMRMAVFSHNQPVSSRTLSHRCRQEIKRLKKGRQKYETVGLSFNHFNITHYKSNGTMYCTISK